MIPSLHFFSGSVCMVINIELWFSSQQSRASVGIQEHEQTALLPRASHTGDTAVGDSVVQSKKLSYQPDRPEFQPQAGNVTSDRVVHCADYLHR